MKNFSIISRRGVRIVGCALLFCAFAYGYGRLLVGEQLSALVSPWCMVAPKWWGVLAAVLVLPLVRYVHRYKCFDWPPLRFWGGCAAILFVIGLLTPSPELHILELRTARLAAQSKWKKALKAGEQSQLCSHTLSALRAYALLQEGGDALPQHFFDYPLPQDASSASLVLPSSLPYGLATPPPSQHKALLSLLLDRRLHHFAQALKAAQLPLQNLPPIYAQALLLHQRSTLSPTLTLHDPVTEANFQDFDQQRKLFQSQSPLREHPSLRAEANLMRPLYGNTYWWYYYYNKPLPS